MSEEKDSVSLPPDAPQGADKDERAAPDVQSVRFPRLSPAPAAGAGAEDIGIVSDVPARMTVELGRTQKTIGEILSLGEGAIVELDKLSGEPVDILVNEKPIAKGEVVIIDGNYGVRITEMLSFAERKAKADDE